MPHHGLQSEKTIFSKPTKTSTFAGADDQEAYYMPGACSQRMSSIVWLSQKTYHNGSRLSSDYQTEKPLQEEVLPSKDRGTAKAHPKRATKLSQIPFNFDAVN